MKVFLGIFLILSLLSCNENKKIIKRYDNGVIKSIHYFGNDKEPDSSIFFSSKQEIEQTVYYTKHDSLGVSIKYDEHGKKYAEGKIVKYDANYKMGKWYFYKEEVDSIVEYINVKDKTYTNQIWIIDKKTRDTIQNRGNFYEIYIQDTLRLTNSSHILCVGDTLKLRFYLYKPFLSYNSEMEVIMPKKAEGLKENFSNFAEIEKDTFYSLQNDGIPHPEIPKEVPQNHNANFGIIYTTPGKKRIRGYIAEYIKNKKGNREERRLYFDKTIYVKDIIKER